MTYDEMVEKTAAAHFVCIHGSGSRPSWKDWKTTYGAHSTYHQLARAALDAASVPALLAVAEAATEWAAAHATTDLSPYTDPDPLTYRRAWQRLANADADLLDALRAYQESDDDVTLVVP